MSACCSINLSTNEKGQKDTRLQPMKAPSTASSSTLMCSILLPMTTCLKDQNCFKPQDGQILKQISEPTEIGLNSLVQTHIKIRCYEIRICHGASRGQCVQTRLGSNFTRFSIRNLCLGVNKVGFCATSTTCCVDFDHLRRMCFVRCRPTLHQDLGRSYI
jgi:hypothetical protein